MLFALIACAESISCIFLTAELSPRLATCGGYDGGNWLASCLVFNPQNQTWDEDTIGDMPYRRAHQAVVTLDNIGVYMIGGYGARVDRHGTTDFLAQDSQQWVEGPTIPGSGPGSMLRPCAVAISQISFLAIHFHSIVEYQVNIENPSSNEGWQEWSKWPQLQSRRTFQPGCSKINNKVVIAGGYYQFTLRTTDVLDLATRKITSAGEMTTPRREFHIVTITTDKVNRVLALAGHDGDSTTLSSVEEFDPDDMTWKLVPANIREGIFRFGAAELPRNLICPV